MPDDDQPGLGDRIARRALEGRVRELADQQLGLQQQLDGFQEPLDDIHKKLDKLLGARRLHWPDLDDDTRNQRWPDLLVWVSDVLCHRYPAEAARVKPCWWRHPAALDALTALWLCWVASYRDPTAPVVEMAVWQTRWLPELIALAAEATTTCDTSRHRDPQPVDLVAGAPAQAP